MLTIKQNRTRGAHEYDVFKNDQKIGEIGPSLADGGQCFRGAAVKNYGDLSADEWGQVSSFLRGTGSDIL